MKKDKKLKDKFSFKTTQKLTLKTDPLGSYTGTPQDPKEEPVQDEDDL